MFSMFCLDLDSHYWNWSVHKEIVSSLVDIIYWFAHSCIMIALCLRQERYELCYLLAA